MTDADGSRKTERQLRLWPAVAIVAVQWLGWYAVPQVAPDLTLYGILAGLAGGPLLGVWWLLFSRAPWAERVSGALLVVAAVAATPYVLHESVAKGNMGFQFYLLAIPFLSLAFVSWAVATRRVSGGLRRATMVAAVLLTCAGFTLVRSKGVEGDGFPELTWRWAPTAEEQLLARSEEPLEIEAEPIPVAETSAPEWPGFRGPRRDGVIHDLRIAADWSASPPVELWRRPIGPGVSSFAVAGDRLYTQEQRGDHEVVTAYDLGTGEPVWRHAEENRFWDSHVGAGPRATPAVSAGRVFTLGASGLLSAFDAGDGRVLWSRDAAADAGSKLPLWGYVSSPLVVGDRVIVHAGALTAYDVVTGEPCWSAPPSGSYSSPQLLSIDGVSQLVIVTHAGVTSVAPDDGRVLWEHSWPGVGIMQPVLTAEGDLLISTIDEGAAPIGTRHLAVHREPAGWKVEERWTSVGLKPSFSPVVVHRDHAYGFDGRFLACIDVAAGERQWKGGRYGSGQLLLLPDQDLLLVISEQGDLALVRATPDAFSELARVPAIQGRTWSQPAVVGDVLVVRNGEEMAAFRLPRSAG